MAVAFNAIGGGKPADTASSDPNNATWSHTCSGSDRAVIVQLQVSRNGNGATSTITRSATYGGIAMTELAAGAYANAVTTPHLFTFGLLNPPTGAQTVAVNVSGVLNGSCGNSISYTGVGGFSAAQMTWGSAAGTAMSQAVTGSAVGDMICQVFGSAEASGQNVGSYTPTPPRFFIGSNTWSKAISCGDAPGSAGTVNFSALRTSAVQWRAHAVILQQAVAGPSDTGAFFTMF